MLQPAPIVESLKGELSFLLDPEGDDRSLRVRRREAEFPTVANMQVALDAHRRAATATAAPYSLVRVGNNMAAALICRGDLAAAFDQLAEAETALVQMIEDAPQEDFKLALSLAVIKFNACVLLLRAGDPTNLELVTLNRWHASRALEQVAEGRDNHQFRFVTAALRGLGD